MSGDLLRLDHLRAGYGPMVVIEDLSFAFGPGERLACLGRNGMGKTTLLASLVRHTTWMGGRLHFDGAEITALDTVRRARRGIGYVPQSRDVFPNLTVIENLAVAARPGPWNAGRVIDLFPRLGQRRGHLGRQLSGGEQQMLSIARALMGNPKLLLLDEPSEGLAPIIVDEMFASLRRLAEGGELAIILVEQHAHLALEFAPRALVLNGGRLAYDGPTAPLIHHPDRLDALIGVGADIARESLEVKA